MWRNFFVRQRKGEANYFGRDREKEWGGRKLWKRGRQKCETNFQKREKKVRETVERRKVSGNYGNEKKKRRTEQQKVMRRRGGTVNIIWRREECKQKSIGKRVKLWNMEGYSENAERREVQVKNYCTQEMKMKKDCRQERRCGGLQSVR